MIQIEAHKTNLGVFFRVVGNYGLQTLKSTNLSSINSTPIADIETAYAGWYIIDELKDFMRSKAPGHTLIGFDLVQTHLECDKIPKHIPLRDVEEEWDDDAEDYKWTGKCAGLRELYSPAYIYTDGGEEEVFPEITYKDELTISNWKSPVEMKVKVQQEGSYGNTKIVETDLSRIATFSDLDRMLVPEFMLPERPCSLSSQQVYKIIRAHVIANIDGKVAKIDSNYDFCFSVQKIVSTAPYEYKRETLTSKGNSYKPPRFSKETLSTKKARIFEMTWHGADKGKGYGDYTCIDAWKGESLEDLHNNIKQFLDELMHVINSPAHECKECNGCGTIFSKMQTNDRGQGVE